MTKRKARLPPAPDVQDWELFREYAKLTDKRSPRALEIRNTIVHQFRQLMLGEVDRFARKKELERNTDALEDYNQVAVEALLYSLDRYDPTRGTVFATPTRGWIWHFLDTYLDKVPCVNQRRMSTIPQHLLRRQDRIRAEHGRDATAEELGVSEAQLERWRYPPIVQSVDVVDKWALGMNDGAENFLTRLARTESSHQDRPDAEEQMIEIEEADEQEQRLSALAGAMKKLTVLERRHVRKAKHIEPADQLEYERIVAKLRDLLIP